MPLPQHTLPVVGINFPNDRGVLRRFEVEICRPGEAIDLRPEPKNEFDSRAVAAYSARGIQIGYLPAERCGRIQAMILQGRTVSAIFQGHDEHRAYIRVAYDGEVPMLPDVGSDEPPQEQDFWPDPTYDD